MKHRRFLITSALAILLGLGVGAGVSIKKAEVKSAKADYSSTIRVYVDLDWTKINYVRLGTDQASGAASLTSSDPKYDQSKGKYVRDIIDDHTYEKMGFFFNQDGTWWQYQYDGGYVWTDGGFALGYQYRLYNVKYVSDSGSNKLFSCSVEHLGAIKDVTDNASFYFVDGHSWHDSGNVYAYYWGGTASCSSFPGEVMSDTALRLKAYVGSKEYSGLHIYKYTLSGSASHVKFSNGAGAETGDLDIEVNGVYFYGIEANDYRGVAHLLISLLDELGSYTYQGRTFTSSICHLSQSQASSFVNTYDDLYNNHGSGTSSSVSGSGIVTYSDPEHSTSTTAEISLAEVREALVKKYPTLGGGNGRIMIFQNKEQFNSTIVIVIVAGVALAAIGGYFFLRKRKVD